MVALTASLIQWPLGDIHAKQVARTQPAKLAAFEGIFRTQSNAPLVALGVVRPDLQKVEPGIELPGPS